MMAINMKLKGDGAWPDLVGKTVHQNAGGEIGISALDNGTQGGKPSVAIRIDLDNGEVVIAQTSLVLFLAAADALKAKYGDPRYEGG